MSRDIGSIPVLGYQLYQISTQKFDINSFEAKPILKKNYEY